MQTLFKSDNNVGAMTKYKRPPKGQPRPLLEPTDESLKNMGTCTALSALWLCNMHKLPPADSKPDQKRASIIFAKNCILVADEAERVTADLADVGLKLDGNYVEKYSMKDMLQHISDKKGYFLMDLEQGHAIAAAVVTAGFFIYDSAKGLYQFDDAKDFVSVGARFLTSIARYRDKQEVWIFKAKAA